MSALFHECLVAEFDVPSADKFQFIEQAADEQRIYDLNYLSDGTQRPLRAVSYFRRKPRSRAQKQGLYRRLCARLDDEMAVSPQDVMVVIQFNQLEDWSFSAGRWRMNNAWRRRKRRRVSDDIIYCTVRDDAPVRDPRP